MEDFTSENKADSSHSEDEGFDSMGLVLDYLAHWKWFAVCGIIALACAYYYYSTIIPTYEVGASIFLSDDKNSADRKSVV